MATNPDLCASVSVLIVHHDLTIGEVMKTVLSEDGYRVVTCRDELTARQCAAAERPRLIVLEWSWGQQWAPDLCDWLQTDGGLADVPILVCIDQPNKLERAGKIIRQRNDVLTEPFDIDLLSAKARRLLETWDPTPSSARDIPLSG